MKQIDLAGTWELRDTSNHNWINGTVPGSVFYDLLKAGKMEDPFYRDNEKQALELASHDYEYRRNFNVSGAFLQSEHILLRCEGLDTLAEIRINGKMIANTENMHRTYEFDIRSVLKEGENEIHILLRSPLPVMNQKQQEEPLWGVDEAVAGYPHIRKAHYMFGWDWGPKIPDAGIWRPISIVAYEEGRLEDIYIRQTHDPNHVTLNISVELDQWTEEPLHLEVEGKSPQGERFIHEMAKAEAMSDFSFNIPDPQLWWPNGYGEQPLYQVSVLVKRKSQVIDRQDYSIGLRMVEIRQEKDEWGESFAFVVNGVPVFAKGANYIPEDNLLGRRDPKKTESLIQDSVEAHFNMLRVWGGGFYPDDDFYNLCDRYGLLVWQDFMFACGVYRMTDDFTENIRNEAEDNVKRIRHHACLALWCGNNEMETAWVDWGFPKTDQLREDYLKQFEEVLPQVVRETDPQTVYWPSSPSSGGSFENPNDENSGDVHYWDVWHGLKPFTEYRKYHFRFVSEFGFQAFPSFKTVKSFTEPEDRNIFSYMMEQHQKNHSANGIILYYLAENFKYPKDFPSLLYVSQILQAEAIKYGVEHWRRERGRCMGTTYWQLNDCWPVASWSSIDSFGRWKALHYFAKKFYAPVLLSACEEGTNVELYATNDKTEPFQGEIVWKLRNAESAIIQKGAKEVAVEPLSVKNAVQLDFSTLVDEPSRRETYLEFAMIEDGETISEGTVLFTKAKHFEFRDPRLQMEWQEYDEEFIVTLQSQAFAKYIELDMKDIDCRFSDNFFDLSAGDVKSVKIKKSSLSASLSFDQLRDQLTVRSLYDSFH